MELRPYAVANFQEDATHPIHSANDWNNLGIDAKYRLASNLTLDATVNPDFAQIEADDEVINLSDYPVYLTEKRPFFLEGASIFDTPIELFYSRRIADPEAGAKISGKVGSVKLMALAARNKNQEHDQEDFGVLRLKRDILSRSEIGMIVTDKEGPVGNWARTWGTDATFHLGKPWTLSGMVTQSYKPEHISNNWAHRVEAAYSSDKYSGSVSWLGLMRDFNVNDAGYMRYSDFQQFYTWLQYAPRPEKWGIRRFSHNINIWQESFYDFSHPGSDLNYNGQIETMNYMWLGWGIEYTDYYRRRYVEEGEPFNNYDNVGNYALERYYSTWEWVWYESDFSKPLAIGLNYSLGGYRDGYEHDASATLQVRPRGNLELSLKGQHFPHQRSS